LVPIRIDLELDNIRLRDTFTWNIHDDLVTPKDFARILCDDLKMPQFARLVEKAIKEQVDDYFAPAALAVAEPTCGRLESPQRDPLPELRITIKVIHLIQLDITIDHQSVVDQFEWDISCLDNNPELFAEHLVREMNLAPEFKFPCIT
jgi:hypothetical protein